MSLEYIKSQKGFELLKNNGYVFRKDKENNESVYWKCVEYLVGKCRARIIVSEGKIKKCTAHNHVAHTAQIEKRNVLHNMKQRALVCQETTQRVVSAETHMLTEAVCGQLPSIPLMKKAVQRIRSKNNEAFANPTSLLDLVIPATYSKIKDEPFLLYDSGPVQDRLLIFSTKKNLAHMARCDHWYADGTFNTAPQLFSQIYTIHAVRYHNVLPTVFILMANKTQTSYVRALTALKNLNSQLAPVSIMTDFEKAAMNAFRKVFPQATQRGCFFHMSQCIWRKIQGCGLQSRYINDSKFALHVRQLAALAFVPEEDVLRSFEELIQSEYFIENYDDLQEVIDYFEDTWIGRLQNNLTRRHPLFPIKIWNCHSASKQGLPKTNNSVEGWHRGFSTLLGVSHPTLWKFIDDLKREQKLNELKIEQYIAGQHPPKSRKIYRDTAQKIEDLVYDYENRDLIDFLRGIAHNFNLQI